jgi:sugar-specific transcriptional regulator TrmB
LLSNWERVSKTRLESPLERFVVIEGDDKIYSRIFQMIENAKKEIVIVISDLTFIRAAQAGIDRLIFSSILLQSNKNQTSNWERT